MEFGDFVVAGATLWADFSNKHIEHMDYFRKRELKLKADGFRDLITDGGSELTPEKLYSEHILSKEVLLSFERKLCKKLIVVTHYPPSHESLHKKFRKKEYEFAIGMNCSDLINEICKSEIDYWFHGHTHYAVDYLINKTRVISNPRRCNFGGYSPNWRMDVVDWNVI